MAVIARGLLRSVGQNSGRFEGVFSYQIRKGHSRTMANGGEEYEVGHDLKKHEFFIQLKQKGNISKKDRAILQYSLVGERELDLYHTFVPDAFRGKGIAKLLAKEAFDHVVKEDLKMHLTCTYLQKYYEEHPEQAYKDRVLQ